MTLLRPATPPSTSQSAPSTASEPNPRPGVLHLRPCSPTTNPSPNGLSLQTLRHAFPGG